MTTEGAIFAEGKRVADANGGEGVVVRPGDILTVIALITLPLLPRTEATVWMMVVVLAMMY